MRDLSLVSQLQAAQQAVERIAYDAQYLLTMHSRNQSSKNTKTRKKVKEYILSSPKPVTIKDVLKETGIAAPSCAKRHLDALVKAGVIRQLDSSIPYRWIGKD
jgi:Fe2+ or Zn2+ uptake regulation protein